MASEKKLGMLPPIRIDDATHSRLRELAEEADRPVSYYVRKVLEHHVRQHDSIFGGLDGDVEEDRASLRITSHRRGGR